MEPGYTGLSDRARSTDADAEPPAERIGIGSMPRADAGGKLGNLGPSGYPGMCGSRLQARGPVSTQHTPAVKWGFWGPPARTSSLLSIIACDLLELSMRFATTQHTPPHLLAPYPRLLVMGNYVPVPDVVSEFPVALYTKYIVHLNPPRRS